MDHFVKLSKNMYCGSQNNVNFNVAATKITTGLRLGDDHSYSFLKNCPDSQLKM